jgi:hypothetical protein
MRRAIRRGAAGIGAAPEKHAAPDERMCSFPKYCYLLSKVYWHIYCSLWKTRVEAAPLAPRWNRRERVHGLMPRSTIFPQKIAAPKPTKGETK